MITYWNWLLKGSGNGAGIARYCNRWLLFHLLVGIFLAWALPGDLKSAAQDLLLPVAGILIGLAFAWGGNAHALLQTQEIQKLAEHRQGGLEEYVYTYQSAILFLLLTLILWAFAGLGYFDEYTPRTLHKKTYFVVATTLFFFASLAVRECWHVVLGAQWLLLTRLRIQKALKR